MTTPVSNSMSSTSSTNSAKTATGSSIIGALGSGSGIDTNALTEQLVSISSQLEAQKLNGKKTTLETQISDYGKLRSALSSFQSAAAALGSADTFNAKSVSIPTTTQFSITALNSSAVAGNYNLQVRQVAQAQTLVTRNAYSSPNDPVGKGELTLRLGHWSGNNFSVNEKKASGTIVIDETNNTLAGLRDAINDAKLGITASIVNDGVGYKLMLNAETGANNEIEITAAEDAGALAAFNFNAANKKLDQQQEGRDAKIAVNGLEVSRETNHITDVIDGLEFDIFSANSSETVAISITADKGAGEQAIRQFVEAYNTLIADVAKLTGFDAELDNFGSLKSDPLAKNLMQVLRTTLASPITGGADLFSTLGSIGIRTKTDGTLEINENPDEPNTNFRAAIDKNYEAVKNLFVPQAVSNNSSVEISKTSALTKAGTYQVQITQAAEKGSLTAGTANATFPVPVDASTRDYQFEFSLDGVTTSSIQLTGIFNSAQDIAVELQGLINSDSTVRAAFGSVSVSFDGAEFQFVSDSYGASSNVGFASVSQDFEDDFGFTVGKKGTAGKDVIGTINGVTGFGFGNVLLANYGSDADGLSLIIHPGVTEATVTFSRGLAGTVNNLVGSYLASNGLISDREATLSKDIEKVDDQKEAMTRRSDAYRARLQAQFIAMESIVRSLNNTGSLLDGLNDRLPFTAKK
jgi:flagellar hook-associated protein 2